jgi:mannonate dehydratase
MKITNATVNITSPGRNFVTQKIETDEGIYGLRDGTLNGRELSVASYLSEHVIPCITYALDFTGRRTYRR